VGNTPGMCARTGAALALCLGVSACLTPYELRHAGQWDARDQIWLSEASQVKLRAAQSRVFPTTDRIALLAAILSTMQDLGFMIEVLDEELGIVSGQLFEPLEGTAFHDPTYHLYDDHSLLLFTRTYRTWGPFFHRNNLVRLTVTVRQRDEAQTVVRASAQFAMAALEDPEPYQKFFRSLEQALFLEARLLGER